MPGLLEVLAVAVGQNLSDQSAAGINVETDRRFGMIDVLRPAGDAGRADAIDIAAQRTDAAVSLQRCSPARSAMRRRTASTS